MAGIHDTEIILTLKQLLITLSFMEVHLKPDTESRLNELASKSGRPTDELVEDAMAGYLAEVAEVRAMIGIPASFAPVFGSGRGNSQHGCSDPYGSDVRHRA